MNKLSWVLYLADIVQNLHSFLYVTICIVSTIFTLVLITYLLWIIYDDHLRKDWKAPLRRYTILLFSLVLTLNIINVFIPTKETMLAIAASETTERVIHSTEGREVLSKLKEKIMERMK